MPRSIEPQRAIIVDKREKDPWPAPPGETFIPGWLPAGDYALHGLERFASVERKSIDDLVRTLIHDRDRFTEELAQLAAMPRAWVIVEGSLVDVLTGRFTGAARPESVLASIASVTVDWNVPVLFAGNRAAAVRLAVSLLRRSEKTSMLRRNAAQEEAAAALR